MDSIKNGPNTVKKILAYVTTEGNPSLFDVVVAHDAGVDVLVPYCRMEPALVAEVVHNSVFTRSPKSLNNTAVFFGGKDALKAKKLFDEARRVLASLPGNFKVSICLDPEGASTTASACVGRVKEAFGGSLSGVKATVLAGTGPVGQRIATLLAKEGASVKLTSRGIKRARDTCKFIADKYNMKVEAFEVSDEKTLQDAIADAAIVVASGSEGVELLPERVWKQTASLKVLADTNAVPPYGIGGVKPTDDLVEHDGKRLLGALAIGGRKMKLHRALMTLLFEKNDGAYDLFEIYAIIVEGETF